MLYVYRLVECTSRLTQLILDSIRLLLLETIHQPNCFPTLSIVDFQFTLKLLSDVVYMCVCVSVCPWVRVHVYVCGRAYVCGWGHNCLVALWQPILCPPTKIPFKSTSLFACFFHLFLSIIINQCCDDNHQYISMTSNEEKSIKASGQKVKKMAAY